jgi:hypothetical protein
MYAILRTKSLKDNTKITQAISHNLRLHTSSFDKNVDVNRIQNNIVLVNSLNASLENSEDFQVKLNKFFESKKCQVRENSVKCKEFVLTSSPEFFEGKNLEEIKSWADHQVKFLQREFGDKLKMVVLHLDELTPHLHAICSTEKTSVKKYKNQKGEFFKETTSLADFTNRKFLIDLHTRYAEHNEKYSMSRGVRGNKKAHTTPKEFRQLLEKTDSRTVKDFENYYSSLGSESQKRLAVDTFKDKKILYDYFKAGKHNKKIKELKVRELEIEQKEIEAEKYLKESQKIHKLSLRLANENKELKRENELLNTEISDYRKKDNADKLLRRLEEDQKKQATQQKDSGTTPNKYRV